MKWINRFAVAVVFAAALFSVTDAQTFYVGEVKLDFNTPKWSSFRDKAYGGPYGPAYGFDFTTDAGKDLYSMLLIAIQANRKVRIQAGPIYDGKWTRVESIVIEGQ
jgi:hypothetical protein